MPRNATAINSAHGVFEPDSYKKLLGPRWWLSWISLGLLVLLAWLPNRLRDLLALGLGAVIALLPIPPQRVAWANLRLAFPDRSKRELRAILRKSCQVALAVVFSYAEPSVLPRPLLKRRWIIRGQENLQAVIASGRPVIFVAPHCFAIDRCGLYLSFSGLPMCTMMHSQRNAVYDWFLNRQRLRFGGTVYERSAGLKAILRELRAGHHCFFLPDEDLGGQGAQSSRFVPFMGAPKATVSSLPRLARVSRAACIQLFSTYNFKSSSFEVYFSAPFDPYPTPDLDCDLISMNRAIEDMLKLMPEQYMWFLRFYQSVPDPSYPDIYCNRKLPPLVRGQKVDYAARRRPFVPARAGDDAAADL